MHMRRDIHGIDVPYSLQQPIIITSWDSGYYAIKPLTVTYDGIDYSTEAMLLSVMTIEVDTTAAPMDIKPIYLEPFSIKDWFKMLVAKFMLHVRVVKIELV